MESYFSRWANVSASPRSFSATISKPALSPCSRAARYTFRPIRPKPLIPTRSGMGGVLLDGARCLAADDRGGSARAAQSGQLPLGGVQQLLVSPQEGPGEGLVDPDGASPGLARGIEARRRALSRAGRVAQEAGRGAPRADVVQRRGLARGAGGDVRAARGGEAGPRRRAPGGGPAPG